jgi:hypothetical protein
MLLVVLPLLEKECSRKIPQPPEVDVNGPTQKTPRETHRQEAVDAEGACSFLAYFRTG